MPYNILLVDDDNEFRQEFREFFGGYEIKEAPNGEEALSMLKKPNEIDLVILDVMMPGLRGTDVLRKIREITPDLGIIILTGYSSEEMAIEALKGRADDYLQKPLDISKTKQTIERLLREKAMEESADAKDIKNKVQRVKQFAERNYHKKVCLSDAAQAVYLSPKYLSRAFKEQTGVGFSEYMQGIRVKKAKEFLKKTGQTIDSISDKLGYLNTESFIRIFKKFTAKTPTEYRKQVRTKVSLKSAPENSRGSKMKNKFNSLFSAKILP